MPGLSPPMKIRINTSSPLSFTGSPCLIQLAGAGWRPLLRQEQALVMRLTSAAPQGYLARKTRHATTLSRMAIAMRARHLRGAESFVTERG
jgi:hypothetical protein